MYYKFLDGAMSPVGSVLKELGFKKDAYIFKIDEVNICEDFNKEQLHGNGFYFADEKNILNFLGYGMTVYDVIIPEDAQIIKIFDKIEEVKTDKIILTNPRKVDINFVNEMFDKGAVISDKKIVGVLTDLIRQKEYDLAKIIFSKIDPNNINIAKELFETNISEQLQDSYIEIFSKVTNPDVITHIYNIATYKSTCFNQRFSEESLILSKISKNLDKPIKQIINGYDTTQPKR